MSLAGLPLCRFAALDQVSNVMDSRSRALGPKRPTFGTKEISDNAPLLDRAAVFEPLSSFCTNPRIDLTLFWSFKVVLNESLHNFHSVYPRFCSLSISMMQNLFSYDVFVLRRASPASVLAPVAAVHVKLDGLNGFDMAIERSSPATMTTLLPYRGVVLIISAHLPAGRAFVRAFTAWLINS